MNTEPSTPVTLLPSSSPTFDILPLSQDIRKAVDALGYTHPTPVQCAVFEPAVRGRDLVVQARTGTGKTAAFGLPILDQLIRKALPAVQTLILTPTRELALQVTNELKQIAQFRGTSFVTLYGGAPLPPQLKALAEGAQIVIGTPGRVLDHLNRGSLDPSSIRVFVLDEADEMLSMGFAKELNAIVQKLPQERQVLFFSATLPPEVERLTQSYLRNPEWITLSSDQVGALDIAHFVYLLKGDPGQELVRILEVEDPESAIVFCNTKEQTERIAKALQSKGYQAAWINSDLEQSEREQVMQRTREGKLRFLVATDVAARGIDISHLTHVINADFPENLETYVHRTGRTGRAGRTGTAISLIRPKDIGNLYLLRLTYKIRPIEKQLPTEGELQTRTEQDLVEFAIQALEGISLEPHDLSLSRRFLTHPNAERLLAKLLATYLGGLSTGRENLASQAAEVRRARNPSPQLEAQASAYTKVQPSLAEDSSFKSTQATKIASPARKERQQNVPQRLAPLTSPAVWSPPVDADDDEPILSQKNAEKLTPAPFPTPPGKSSEATKTYSASRGFTSVYLNIGLRDGVRQDELAHFLAKEAHIEPSQIGRIRFGSRSAFVEVQNDHLEQRLASWTGKTWKGRNIIAELARPTKVNRSR